MSKFVTPTAVNLPNGQVVHIVDPETEYFPASHTTQDALDTDPTSVLYVPALQDTHVVSPEDEAYDPGAHS